MTNNLFIIEAPGKKRLLQDLLKKAGIRDAEVVATVGHICKNPEHLNPISIDADYKETAYGLDPSKERLCHEIMAAAKQAKKIYIATDDDQEGDVIARDVAMYCIDDNDRNKAFRMRLKALVPSEVGSSMSQAKPIGFNDAARGDARRIIDRLIGGLSEGQVPVGRVQGSLLLMLGKQQPVLGVKTFCMESKDGRGLWIAKCPIFSKEEIPENTVVECSASVGCSHISTVSGTVMNYNEILLAASLSLNESVTDVSRSMQSLYENGRLSYPRSKANSITPESFNRLQAIASISGAGFDISKFNHVRAGDDKQAHEAPNPQTIDIPINRDISMMTMDEKVLVHITRNLIECGIPCKYEEPCHEDVSSLPLPMQSLEWHRVAPLGQRLWEDKPNEPGVQLWTLEQSMLHFSNYNQMGRPSTIVSHLQKFLGRGLINKELSLSEKGKQWHEQIDNLFGSKNISKIIETYLDINDQAPSKMVSELISLCGLESVGTFIKQQGIVNEEYEV